MSEQTPEQTGTEQAAQATDNPQYQASNGEVVEAGAEGGADETTQVADGGGQVTEAGAEQSAQVEQPGVGQDGEQGGE